MMRTIFKATEEQRDAGEDRRFRKLARAILKIDNGEHLTQQEKQALKKIAHQ